MAKINEKNLEESIKFENKINEEKNDNKRINSKNPFELEILPQYNTLNKFPVYNSIFILRKFNLYISKQDLLC